MKMYLRPVFCSSLLCVFRLLRSGIAASRRAELLAVALVLLASGARPALAGDEAPALAVAASLRTLWPALAALQPPLAARVSFGASGTLMQQIRRGAPFELFLSADEASVQYLVDEGLTLDQGSVYASGALVLATRAESAFARQAAVTWPAWISFATARANDGQPAMLAIPNPMHAPYGRAALQVLKRTPAAPVIQQIVGENAAQTLQFVLTGAVDAALVPRSLINTAEQDDLLIGELDETLYDAVRHRMVLLKDAGPEARAWFDRIRSGAGQAVLAAAGLRPAP